MCASFSYLTDERLRIADEKTSVDFYQRQFGMTVLSEHDNPEGKFKIIFLGFDGPGAMHAKKPLSDREGLLELTYNYPSSDPFKANNGNSGPGKGFGHICVSVNNIKDACTRLEKNGVQFQKKLTDGRMKNIAFALDPDGYWIELVDNGIKGDGPTDLSTYRFNHTMIRICDAQANLDFFQNILGMKLVRTGPSPEAKFTNYFLAYGRETGSGEEPTADREGIVELCHNWEGNPPDGYANGNSEPYRGFGHLCICVDNLDAACKFFEEKGVKWQKRLTEGRMKEIAFILSPDASSYWIEIVENTTLKNV